MSDDLRKILSTRETTKDEQIAKIEGDLQSERDSRKQERFIWVFAIMIIFDAYFFRELSFTACIVMMVFELIFLIIIGQFWGVNEVYIVTRNVLDAVGKFLGKYRSDKT